MTWSVLANSLGRKKSGHAVDAAARRCRRRTEELWVRRRVGIGPGHRSRKSWSSVAAPAAMSPPT